jgi:hypothetical protein
MKHDYENAQRGAMLEATGKTRVTMYLDDDVIEFFRDRATKNGRGYQTEINSELRNALSAGSKKVSSRRSDDVVIVDLATGIHADVESLRREISGFRSELVHIRGLETRPTRHMVERDDRLPVRLITPKAAGKKMVAKRAKGENTTGNRR